jgi:hypothetical protein
MALKHNKEVVTDSQSGNSPVMVHLKTTTVIGYPVTIDSSIILIT